MINTFMCRESSARSLGRTGEPAVGSLTRWPQPIRKDELQIRALGKERSERSGVTKCLAIRRKIRGIFLRSCGCTQVFCPGRFSTHTNNASSLANPPAAGNRMGRPDEDAAVLLPPCVPDIVFSAAAWAMKNRGTGECTQAGKRGKAQMRTEMPGGARRRRRSPMRGVFR